jgi:hypothetical protein
MARFAARGPLARAGSTIGRKQLGGVRGIWVGVLLAISACMAGLWLLAAAPAESSGGTAGTRAGAPTPTAEFLTPGVIGLAGLTVGVGFVWMAARGVRRWADRTAQQGTPVAPANPANPSTEGAAPPAAATAATPVPAPGGRAGTESPRRSTSVSESTFGLGRVVAVGLNCAAGEDLAAWRDDQSRGLCLARPHARLRHLDGLPVVSVHPEGDGLQAWQQEVDRDPELAMLRRAACPLTQRALATLAPALGRVLPDLRHLAPALPEAPPDNAFQLRRSTAHLRRTPPTLLHIEWIAPSASPADTEFARAWLTRQIQPCLPGGVAWSIHAAEEPAEVVLQQAAKRAASGHPDPGTNPSTDSEAACRWQLILAAHSDLDADHLHALEAAGQLFHGLDHPQGEWASEAAVALLWAPARLGPGLDHAPAVLDLRVGDTGAQHTPATWPLAATDPPAPALVDRDTDPWPALVASCLETSAAVGFEPLACVSDVAPRTHDIADWARAVEGIRGRWDAMVDVGFTASTAGRGPIASVLALAAAVERARQRPTLLVSGPRQHRLVASLAPPR